MDALATYENVAKRFGDIAAVDDLSFEVPRGTVCGLLGPNGAGKTTAIRILLGLARPTRGSTTLLGLRPQDARFHEAIRRVGTLIEGPALYQRATARENMRIEATALGLDSPGPQIDELLELVGLTDRADSRSGNFSLGMKQRLGLAMALLGEPRLVVLDEPTNGLDPAGIVEIRQLIKRLPERGTTVLVSSHLLSEVELMCDRAAIIQRGRLVADGAITDLVGRHAAGAITARVAPAQATTATIVLEAAGIDAQQLGEGALRITSEVSDGSEISRALAEAGIYVRELTQERAGLEQVFLALTGDGEEGDTAAQPGPIGGSEASAGGAEGAS